jgi:hypothetical protein
MLILFLGGYTMWIWVAGFRSTGCPSISRAVMFLNSNWGVGGGFRFLSQSSWSIVPTNLKRALTLTPHPLLYFHTHTHTHKRHHVPLKCWQHCPHPYSVTTHQLNCHHTLINKLQLHHPNKYQFPQREHNLSNDAAFHMTAIQPAINLSTKSSI